MASSTQSSHSNSHLSSRWSPCREQSVCSWNKDGRNRKMRKVLSKETLRFLSYFHFPPISFFNKSPLRDLAKWIIVRARVSSSLVEIRIRRRINWRSWIVKQQKQRKNKWKIGIVRGQILIQHAGRYCVLSFSFLYFVVAVRDARTMSLCDRGGDIVRENEK